MEIFRKLQLWMDPVERPGPEAMAVDEWLLETARIPVLRVYRWSGEWASLGYFGKIEAARTTFPGIELVRRWTGGGMVDHRADWTYTVVAPQGEPLAGRRGAESYRRLHEALGKVLVAEGTAARMSGGGEETGRGLCFENPVTHDLLGADGRKLAGAGQRRSLQGLLHQGSVAGQVEREVSEDRARAMARILAREWEDVSLQPETADLASRVTSRYRSAEWIGRR